MESGIQMIARTVLLAAVLALLGACATAETKVSCEGRLQPINVPVAAKVGAVARNTGAATQGVSP